MHGYWHGDYFAQILRDYLTAGHTQTTTFATCAIDMLDARHFVDYAVEWRDISFGGDARTATGIDIASTVSAAGNGSFTSATHSSAATHRSAHRNTSSSSCERYPVAKTHAARSPISPTTDDLGTIPTIVGCYGRASQLA